MNITIVQTFTDGFTTYQSGQELSVPSEVAQRWIADGKAQADTDGQQSWLSSTEVAATRALVSGDGDSGNAIVDALVEAATSAGYTWADKPSAAGNTGRVIRITDVGATAGGSHWVSDGAYWRTMGQIDLVRRNRSPYSPITQNSSGSDFLFTLPASIIIPANMIVPGESEIDVEFAVRRSGAVGGTATARAWLGPNNSAATDSLLVSANLTAVDNSVQNPTVKVMARSTVLATTSSFQQRMGTSAATGAWYDSSGGVINFAVAQYINFGVFAPNASDTYQLFIARVSVRV